MPGLGQEPKSYDVEVETDGATCGYEVDGDPIIVVEGSIVTGNATMAVLPLLSVIGSTTVVAIISPGFALYTP